MTLSLAEKFTLFADAEALDSMAADTEREAETCPMCDSERRTAVRFAAKLRREARSLRKRARAE